MNKFCGFAVAFVLISSLLAISAFADVAPSSCTTYAQARAYSPSLASKSDAELRALGFCAGTGTTTPTQSTTPTQTTTPAQTQGTQYTAGDERTTETGTDSYYPADMGKEYDSYYAGMSYDELNNQYTIISNEWNACEDPNSARFDNCIATCDYSKSDCRCYDTWVVKFNECNAAYDKKAAAISRAIENIDWDAYYNGGQEYEEPAGISDIQDDDSAALMEAVSGKHQIETAELQNYYNRQPSFPGGGQNEYAANANLEATRPLGFEVINAKNDYQRAANSKASNANQLKEEFESKLQEMKNRLIKEVLWEDEGNPDALWQMATLYKWEGDNINSYKYYRDALKNAKARDPFYYQKLVDSITDPAMKMQILQSLEPQENIATLPSVESSPFLMGVKGSFDTLMEKVDSTVREESKVIEKISRAFSYSHKIDDIKEELGIYGEE